MSISIVYLHGMLGVSVEPSIIVKSNILKWNVLFYCHLVRYVRMVCKQRCCACNGSRESVDHKNHNNQMKKIRNLFTATTSAKHTQLKEKQKLFTFFLEWLCYSGWSGCRGCPDQLCRPFLGNRHHDLVQILYGSGCIDPPACRLK